jgi:hypothetical protein
MIDAGTQSDGTESRERIVLESILRIAEHGRVISTSHHEALHAIAKHAAQQLRAIP